MMMMVVVVVSFCNFNGDGGNFYSLSCSILLQLQDRPTYALIMQGTVHQSVGQCWQVEERRGIHLISRVNQNQTQMMCSWPKAGEESRFSSANGAVGLVNRNRNNNCYWTGSAKHISREWGTPQRQAIERVADGPFNESYDDAQMIMEVKLCLLSRLCERHAYSAVLQSAECFTTDR